MTTDKAAAPVGAVPQGDDLGAVDVLAVLTTAESGYRSRAALESDPEHKPWLVERADEAAAARAAVTELIEAAQRVLDKEWEYGDDQPHCARLNAAIAQVKP